MEHEEEKPIEKPYFETKVIGIEDIIIPTCCKEGWASCPHVLKPHKKVKKNIGL
ncbi:MAG: hypothetical protein V4469_04445 [Patescibacteria group bacterium]